MFEAIIFDFDGVILDSEPIHYQACCYALNNVGLELSYEQYVERYLGLADKEMFPKLLKDNSHPFSEALVDTLIEQKIARYTLLIHESKELPITLGLRQYLIGIQDKQKIAICSAATQQEINTVLAKIKLPCDFNTIVTTEDVIRTKPSPEGYLLAAKKLGISPEKCLVFEDSPHGIEAAKSAGMFVIALLTTHHQNELKKADKIIKNFTELLVECTYIT
ncbi:HAD-superfamily hydrolase [Legionella santicrucis]|uniref:HAD-superfamily hydrolase n=1 Tax=Legionella santicrucis TaxID=45074 RepID=A0A0W0YJM1_9GAMM|nr:HAD family phosphatase [Legionella santicrucis]KTD56755.1 HAD-superfamily hydrolase [Legionella santicrucis]